MVPSFAEAKDNLAELCITNGNGKNSAKHKRNIDYLNAIGKVKVNKEVENMPADDFKEKRKFSRLNLSVLVDYKIVHKDSSESGNTKNISAGGICLIVYEDIEIGSQLKLNIYLPEQDFPLLAEGRVVWKDDFIVGDDNRIRFEVGIEFIKIDERDRQVIANYVFGARNNLSA